MEGTLEGGAVQTESPGRTNEELAQALEEVAGLLEAQGANQFRVAAYRKAAGIVRQLPGSVTRMLDVEGPAALMHLPGIGRSLAHAIDQLARTGKFPLLERLRGDTDPERAFATVPDIGPGLARRIHEQLGIETLAELEGAAYDGRLAEVRGFGQKRLRAVRDSLAGRHRPARQPLPPPTPNPEQAAVAVDELLSVDEEYRRLGGQGKLPRIAPRRFNPTHESWLPVLHASRGERHYTALYSNTARAHELGVTHDWVVIYLDHAHQQGRWTIITSQFGRLKGRRIVRGRESECEAYYAGLAGS